MIAFGPVGQGGGRIEHVVQRDFERIQQVGAVARVIGANESFQCGVTRYRIDRGERRDHRRAEADWYR